MYRKIRFGASKFTKFTPGYIRPYKVREEDLWCDYFLVLFLGHIFIEIS